MNKDIAQVKNYYDIKINEKIRGFVEGNPRIEGAWLTVEQWTPSNPQRILEIGCGIGDISWRMSRCWPESEVIGLDISPKSLEIARKLFGSPRLSFVEGPLTEGILDGKFDLIVLLDVYEHIAIADRPILHEALKQLLNERGRLILAFPTPRKQANLKQYHPEQIQPVDENINNVTILALADHTETEVFLYQEVDIWHEGDYAHAVLGKRTDWLPAIRNYGFKQGIRGKIRDFVLSREQSIVTTRSKRLALLHQKLGPEYYSN